MGGHEYKQKIKSGRGEGRPDGRSRSGRVSRRRSRLRKVANSQSVIGAPLDVIDAQRHLPVVVGVKVAEGASGARGR